MRTELLVIYRSDSAGGDAYCLSACDELAARRTVAANTAAGEDLARKVRVSPR